MTALLLFAATFAVVFLLGLQQLNVEHGHKLAAFVTSPLIALSSLVLFKILPGFTSSFEVASHLLGGALGIVSSMWMHPRMIKLFVRQPIGEAAPLLAFDDAGERLGESLRLATEIADEAARTEINLYCTSQRMGRFVWYDVSKPDPAMTELSEWVAKMLRYLELRGCVKRHPQQPNLVRFPTPVKDHDERSIS